MHRRRTRRQSLGLIAAAYLAFASLASCSAVAEPEASTASTVEVDLYSGQKNPVVPLSAGAFHELQAFIADHEQEPSSDDSLEGDLGFRGLVVTPGAPDDSWTSARVVPNAVFVTNGTKVTRVADAEGAGFTLTWNDIRGKLDPTIVTAVEQSK